MIENQKDKEATKAARKAKEIHAPSWISIAGHVYLENPVDTHALREVVIHTARSKCAICGEYCPPWDGDVDHVKSGRPFQRCWCHFRPLADGTICTNVQWVHGMFSTEPCHRNKHNREVKWTPPSNS